MKLPPDPFTRCGPSVHQGGRLVILCAGKTTAAEFAGLDRLLEMANLGLSGIHEAVGALAILRTSEETQGPAASPHFDNLILLAREVEKATRHD